MGGYSLYSASKINDYSSFYDDHKFILDDAFEIVK